MTYTLTIRRNVGRVTVERLCVTLSAPDESTARVLASRYAGRRWRVEMCSSGEMPVTEAPGSTPDNH